VVLFFVRFILLFFFVLIFLFLEFKIRKKKNLHPQKLSELFSMGSKWKKGSDAQIAALMFAVSCFFGFVLWESLILCVLNLYPWLSLGLPVGVLSAVLLLRKRQSFHEWSFREAIELTLSIGLIGGAFFCWVLFPWIYIRAQFLKKKQNSNRL
jgi:ABC-type Fe3+ transport system permease subunit